MDIRLANHEDLDAVVAIYDRIFDDEESGRVTIGWQRGVYPSRETAEAALREGELYVLELAGRIVASAIINGKQVADYARVRWEHDVEGDQVTVLHTLTVDPEAGGRGIGRAFIDFYESLAQKWHRPYLRIDTNAKNTRARKMYASLGYREVGIVPTTFNGIEGVNLVMLEKVAK